MNWAQMDWVEMIMVHLTLFSLQIDTLIEQSLKRAGYSRTVTQIKTRQDVPRSYPQSRNNARKIEVIHFRRLSKCKSEDYDEDLKLTPMNFRHDTQK